MGWSDKYWKENRSSILDRRKKKYANDPEHREKAKKRAREYRAKKRAEREAFLSDPFVMIDGNKVSAMTVDQLCEKIGIDKARLKYMQKAGYLPNAIVNRPVRLYTDRQAAMIQSLDEFLRESSGLLRAGNDEVADQLEQKLTTMKNLWETP